MKQGVFMLRLNALMLAGVFTVPAALAATDPSLLGLVMPDAKVVTGIKVSQSQASPFGQYVFSQMQLGANFDKLATAIGFDPRRDLQEIVVAAADVQVPNQGSNQNPDQSGLVLARGAFQPAKIAAVASLAGASVSAYKGFEILGNRSGGGKNSGVVFLDPSTVATGDVSSLQALIDRRIAGAVFSGSLAQKALEASAANDAWFATATPSAFLAGRLPGLNSGGSNAGGLNPVLLLQSVVATSGGVKFAASGVTASVEAVTNTSQDAQALADVIRFLTSMVQMNRNSNPAGSKVASLADGATITANGPVMRFTVSLPEQQLEQLLMPAPGAAKAKKVAIAR
jgi:hypothetical protein